MTHTALGLFSEPRGALAAAEGLHRAGLRPAQLMSPVPVDGVEEVLGTPPSAIKRFTFFGAIFGATFGFILAAGTAVLYLHPTGGRPIITIPPFLIIAYEMTILFGILATVIGFFISARLPAITERVYAPETAVDKFGVSVICNTEDELSLASQVLSDAGAAEVREIKGAN